MAEQTQLPPVIDPDNVPEIFCDGQFNISVGGGMGLLTFTSVRPDAGQLFAGNVQLRSIVRARILIPAANLNRLRDMLNNFAQSENPAPSTAGGFRH